MSRSASVAGAGAVASSSSSSSSSSKDDVKLPRAILMNTKGQVETFEADTLLPETLSSYIATSLDRLEHSYYFRLRQKVESMYNLLGSFHAYHYGFYPCTLRAQLQGCPFEVDYLTSTAVREIQIQKMIMLLSPAALDTICRVTLGEYLLLLKVDDKLMGTAEQLDLQRFIQAHAGEHPLLGIQLLEYITRNKEKCAEALMRRCTPINTQIMFGWFMNMLVDRFPKEGHLVLKWKVAQCLLNCLAHYEYHSCFLLNANTDAAYPEAEEEATADDSKKNDNINNNISTPSASIEDLEHIRSSVVSVANLLVKAFHDAELSRNINNLFIEGNVAGKVTSTNDLIAIFETAAAILKMFVLIGMNPCLDKARFIIYAVGPVLKLLWGTHSSYSTLFTDETTTKAASTTESVSSFASTLGVTKGNGVTGGNGISDSSISDSSISDSSISDSAELLAVRSEVSQSTLVRILPAVAKLYTAAFHVLTCFLYRRPDLLVIAEKENPIFDNSGVYQILHYYNKSVITKAFPELPEVMELPEVTASLMPKSLIPAFKEIADLSSSIDQLLRYTVVLHKKHHNDMKDGPIAMTSICLPTAVHGYVTTTYCAEVGCFNIARSRCSKCVQTSYCSKFCQKKHWLSHRTFCCEIRLRNMKMAFNGSPVQGASSKTS